MLVKMIKYIVFIFLSSLIVIKANDGLCNEKDLELPEYEMVVVGKKPDKDPFSSERSIEIEDSKKLAEQAPRSVPEVLKNTQGVFVQHTNFGGGAPIIRGLIGPQVLIVVDGIRFSNSVYRTGPIQYLNLIDLFSVEKIEVLRGPGSLLFGSDAMGGMIQVYTHSPDNTQYYDNVSQKTNVTARYYSANEGGAIHGRVHMGINSNAVIAGVSYRDFDDLMGGGDIGRQIYSGYKHMSAIGKLSGYVPKGMFSGLGYTFGYLSSKIEDAGRTDKLFDKKSLQFYDNQDHLLYSKFHMRFPSFKTKADLSVSYQFFLEVKNNHKLNDDLSIYQKTTVDEVIVNTLGFDLKFVTKMFSNKCKLNYGAMFYTDFVDAERKIKNFVDSEGKMIESAESWQITPDKNYPNGSRYGHYGLYLLARTNLFRHKLNTIRFKGGYRFHGVDAIAPAYNEIEEVSFKTLGHVFLASLQYLYSSKLNIAVTFSQGFRAPNLQESAMLGDSGKYFNTPNSDLNPEKSDTFELLFKSRFNRLILSSSVYVSFIDDLITRGANKYKGESEIDGKEVMTHLNKKNAFVYGYEGGFLIKTRYGISLNAQLTYTFGEMKDDNNNKPMTRIPPLFGQAVLRYERKLFKKNDLFIDLFIRGANKQDRLSEEDITDTRIPEGGTKSWLTLNSRIGYSVIENLRINIALENILDKEYKYHGSGVYGPGRNLIISFSFDG